MDWTSEAILLSARPQGESSALVELLTPERGRHLGLVRGGTGRRMRPILQPGAQVQAHWRARLDDQLGTFTIEPMISRAARVLGDPERLAALSALCALAAFALPEREPQPRLYSLSLELLDLITGAVPWQGAYLRWERALLEETGFGLDLSECALSGANDGLAYVSPKTGRAVTASAGAQWADRLLPLPPALLREEEPGSGDFAAGLATTGHFLETVLAPALGTRPLPAARTRLAARFSRG